MVWFKVDDSLPFHAKVVQAGNAAMGLWVRAGAWSAQQLTDGFVPDHIIDALGTRGQAKKLSDARLWVRGDKDGSSGYFFHQWNEDGRQPTRAAVEKERAEARERMRKAREDKKAARSAEVRANTGRSSGAVRSTRPDPARPGPSFSSVETSVGNATEVDAWRDPNEPPKCRKHKGLRRAFIEDCHGCEIKRKQWEISRAASAEFGRDPWCGDDECDPITRKRTTPFGLILCPECHPLAEEASA